MRNFISLVLAFAIIIISVPVVSVVYKDELINIGGAAVSAETSAPSSQSSTSAEETTSAPQKAKISTPKKDKVKVLLTKNKKIDAVSLEYYIVSVLAKEIDINSPDEALKAQAVCIYTFLLHTQESTKSEKYDITDDSSVHQSYLCKADLKKFWGKNYDINYERLSKVVKSVYAQYLTYGGKVILAAYHSSNSGLTESSENYWGSAYPYLVPAVSTGDRLCADYKRKSEFTPAALKAKLKTLKDKKFNFPESPSDWIGEHTQSRSGTVMKINIGGAELTGREVREALALKSAVFTIDYKGGKFIFTTCGYGHGVGLSQEGAKYMAKLGFSYSEILKNYYKGCELSGID